MSGFFQEIWNQGPFGATRPVERETLEDSIARARSRILWAVEGGRVLTPDVVDPILSLVRKTDGDPISEQEERDFYLAYGRLNGQIADVGDVGKELSDQPFEDAVSDSEQLLKHAASVGASLPDDVLLDILNARTALNTDSLTAESRAKFYSSYTKLSSLFGAVSAETIRNCTSRSTRRHLRRLSRWAVATTILVALLSIFTFVSDQTSKKIVDEITKGNELAVQLRAGLVDTRDNKQDIDEKYIKKPCDSVIERPGDNDRKVQTTEDITKLQAFSANTRDLRSNAIKLNDLNKKFMLLSYNECDPYDKCFGPIDANANLTEEEKRKKEKDDAEKARKELELNPSIKNYVAETLCKISIYQEIRSFATNVNSNYLAIFGALLSYALPILYALLGAWAYQLRAFSDAVQKKTYSPSFSDSARIITAVIAGAIAGLFSPAKSLEISPLATAFLVGYGVEIFFRFLDSLINAFGSREAAAAKTAK